jgi:two-component system, NtrC family, C4-dicarboxylate transport response regulator DctD
MTTMLIDDDDTLRAMLHQAFELEGMEIVVEADAINALKCIGNDYPGIVITDVRMPSMDGLTLFHKIRGIDPEIPVILMTGHGDIPMVIDAMRAGVFDFVTKPFSPDVLIASARRAMELRALVLENRVLRSAADAIDHENVLIGETPAMIKLRSIIRQLAQTDIDVLVQGETGTGKELVALLLHRRGKRRSKRFVAVNCAAIHSGIGEAELLGHAQGALSQYRWGQSGFIEQSDGGTLFLDEVCSLPMAMQGILLRVVEEREVRPIGSSEPKSINLRVVAATNIDLAAAVKQGNFRDDLYYRLNPIQLTIPPLRDRKADIPLLFSYFLNEASQQFRKAIPDMGRDVHVHLTTHHWPGNARELRSYAQRVLLGLDSDERVEDIGVKLPLPDRVAQFEAMLIRQALTKVSGNIQEALEHLGIPRNTFYDKLKRYDIQPSDFRK